jgi:anthranilate phosphoribosyltransferase
MSNWKDILGLVTNGSELSFDQAHWAMTAMMSGTSTDAQIAAFVASIKVRGESATEVHGLVSAMLENATRVQVDCAALDIVGTGGDGAHSVNVSTMAAIVAAGAGVPILKHGNRAISSKTGTADVLEALGVQTLEPHLVGTCLAQANIAFCFAPAHHPALKYAANVRKELAVPTIFNVLGPLANPGQPQAALLGCANLRLAPVLAQVQANRGLNSIVVRGDDGLDEISTTTTTQVWEVVGNQVRVSAIDPMKFGIPVAAPEDLRGEDANYNAKVVRDLLAGSDEPKIRTVRDIVLINAATALVAFDSATSEFGFGSQEEPLTNRIARSLPVAAQSIDSGAAAAALAQWAAVTAQLTIA